MTRRIVLVLVLALVTACGDASDQATGPGTPLLLVGIDGLDWDVALPLVREGRMPHLEALMQRGSFGTLETYAPAMSPVIWTTIATGKKPERHGIADFTYRGADGAPRLYTSADRRTKALWNILSDAGQRSVFVGWWNTFPAEPVDGVIVSQANTLEQIAARRMLKPGGMLTGETRQVHPPSRMDEIWTIVEGVDFELPRLREEIFGPAAHPRWPGDRANLEACIWSIRADESMRRVALALLAERPRPAVAGVYFGLPDVVGHRFWRFHEPEAFAHPPPAEAVAAFGEVVRLAYVHADAIVGQLVAAVGESTDVLVLSDHGMHAHNRSSRFDVAVDGRLERESGGHQDGPDGLLVAAGPSIRRVGSAGTVREIERADLPRIGSVVDVAPTVLALRGIPLGRDMDGSVMQAILREPVAPTFVATHDTSEWLASRGGAAPETPGTAERLEQLRSLGYIEN